MKKILGLGVVIIILSIAAVFYGVFKVILKDITKVDKDGIQRLGAKGIVEVDNQLKIIFGRDSRALKKCIKDFL